MPQEQDPVHPFCWVQSGSVVLAAIALALPV